MSGMDCRTCESMVTRYINHSLTVEELEAFLDHVESCPSCYEELETNFVVHEALQQLDETDDGNLDFRSLLEQDIHKSRRYLRKNRLFHLMVGVLCMIMIGTAATLIIFILFQMHR